MSPELEAQASALTLQVLTGVSPRVDGTVVSFTPEQAAQARAGLNRVLSAMQWNKTVSGHPVQYDMGNVVIPVIARQAWWMILLALGIGYWAGGQVEERRKRKKGA